LYHILFFFASVLCVWAVSDHHSPK